MYKIFLLIAVISAIVYANSINNGFVYDDKTSIIDNPYIRDIKNIPASFIQPDYLTSAGIRNHYRPLVVVSHTLNYAIDNLNPAVFRITNLLFHIGTAFMLFLVLKAILGNSKQTLIPLASALIFAVHPFNSETVNYIVARSSVMSGFFYLSAFYCWVRYRWGEAEGRRKKLEVFYLGSLLAFLLGMLTKEVVITLPIVLWLYDFYFIHKLRPPHSSLRTVLNWRVYLPYLPFIFVIIIPLVFRVIYADGGVIPPFNRDLSSQIFTVMPVLVGYLRLLFLPTGLTIAHDVKIYNTPFAASVVISALVLLLFVINAIYLSKRKESEWRLLSFFMAWYLVTLLVIIIVPLNRIMQENRCYISGAVFAVFVSMLIEKLAYSRNRRKLAYGILVVLILFYGVGTAYRNTVWRDGVTLWTDAMKKSPNDLLVYKNLSVAYKNIRNYDMGKEILHRGIMLFPENWELHYNLGIAYKITGELELAMYEFEQARILDPRPVSIYVGMGSLYLHKGDTETGIKILQEVINKKPEYAPAHYYMAKALQKSGRPEEARMELDKALHYANRSYDRELAERITGYIKEGYIERGIIVEDLAIPSKALPGSRQS